MTDDAKLKAFQIRRTIRFDSEKHFAVVGQDLVTPYDIATVAAGCTDYPQDMQARVMQIKESSDRAYLEQRFYREARRLGHLMTLLSMKGRRARPMNYHFTRRNYKSICQK